MALPSGCGFRLRPIHREDHLSNFDLLALFHADLLHRPAHRRRHLDHRLVGFQLHDRLARVHFGSRLYHQAHEIALRNIFSQLRKFEFNQFSHFVD